MSSPQWPFVIFALPRSRTAWLAKWLSYDPAVVGHDLAIEADSVQQFLDQLWHGRAGTVETAAVIGHHLLRLAMPTSKFVTIRRPRGEVLQSLAKFGIEGDWLEEELALRDSLLDEVESLGATRVDFEELASVHCCAWLFEHLLGVPFDFTWWQIHDKQNVQVDVARTLARQGERKEALARLRREVEDATVSSWTGVRVGLEFWPTFWPEAEALGKDHYLEANGGVEDSAHPYRINAAEIERFNTIGAIQICSARINGKLVGYMSWTIGKDLESEGVIQATQGATYVVPKTPGIWQKMRDWSLSRLRSLGVQTVYWHAPMHGRGKKLGLALERLGASPYQMQYRMELTRGTGFDG